MNKPNERLWVDKWEKEMLAHLKNDTQADCPICGSSSDPIGFHENTMIHVCPSCRPEPNSEYKQYRFPVTYNLPGEYE